MIVLSDIIQGSEQWFKAKLGIPGSSSFDKIITTTGAISKQRTDYLYKLAAEILTGNQEETYQSAA
ncbi:MAG: exonuclease, partial [Candidatus Woesearchaeota archaeon]